MKTLLLTSYLQVITIVVWHTLAVAQAITSESFMSSPANIDGVLTACPGEQISLTCSRNESSTGITRWIFGPPVDCNIIVDNVGSDNTGTCGPFSFQNVTATNNGPGVLTSTAVANASISMSGSVIECRDNAGITGFNQIGNAISLCIIDQPSNVTVNDGSTIIWNGCIGAIYRVVVTPINDSEPVASKNVTLSTTTTIPNLEPNQEYSVSVTAIGTLCTTNSATTRFIAQTSTPATTTTASSVTDRSGSEQQSTVTDSSDSEMKAHGVGVAIGLGIGIPLILVGMVVAAFIIIVVLIVIKPSYLHKLRDTHEDMKVLNVRPESQEIPEHKDDLHYSQVVPSQQGHSDSDLPMDDKVDYATIKTDTTGERSKIASLEDVHDEPKSQPLKDISEPSLQNPHIRSATIDSSIRPPKPPRVRNRSNTESDGTNTKQQDTNVPSLQESTANETV